MKNIFKPLIIISSSVIQIILFAIFFFIITSTIEWFTWYEPLTMGAGFAMVFITPFQIVITPILWMFYESSIVYKRIAITSTIHLCLILFNLIFTLINGNFVTFISIGTVLLQPLISLIFIVSLIVFLRKPKQ
ncbi:hypothetical protein AWH56_011325 [Anaerobacillus isosaccharinicus]|uniref:Uncharacterized protein n=1 Tax=Anaerobacillus isosaccharinicus TaxID=1532552 RepID=A0A1S2MDQ5_9BACI|nr:hypothetical protein [Anaerobacillus isosaccharinicus]MBA5588506.1 hypothetical protein [Anaerobacillus isosaccharinicus]QOY38069.1 hypothetical protein AWH56_011325 [Anaerobacillus isosaccharinicus]